LLEQSIPGAKVIASSVSPERNHVGMLAKQQDIRNGAGFARLDEPLLQFTRGPVGD